MIAKYHVEYGIDLGGHTQVSHYQTDDPVACEEFLLALLERSGHLRSIKHEGVELSRHDADRLLKTAAGMLAAKHLCACLKIKPEEERHRFGFTA